MQSSCQIFKARQLTHTTTKLKSGISSIVSNERRMWGNSSASEKVPRLEHTPPHLALLNYHRP